jgi:hypothetical protein
MERSLRARESSAASDIKSSNTIITKAAAPAYVTGTLKKIVIASIASIAAHPAAASGTFGTGTPDTPRAPLRGVLK